jgi:hypothetical protein
VASHSSQLKDEEDEGEAKNEAEGDEDRDAAPHEPRYMDPTDPATRNSCLTSAK